MDHAILMGESGFSQTTTVSRKRTNSIVEKDNSPGCDRSEKKVCHDTPMEAQQEEIPLYLGPEKASTKARPISLSFEKFQKSAESCFTGMVNLPAFTTVQLTLRKDGTVHCEILGFYDTMDEANTKVIMSWEPAWNKDDGKTTECTREDGSIWWQKEINGDLVQVHASQWR